MSETITWLLAIESLGVAALPLTVWLLRALPDRGVAYAKPLGLLVVGYSVWLGSAFSVLAHTRATAVAASLLLGALAWARFGRETTAWLRLNKASFLAAETIFLVAFLLAATLRAFNPEISGTEKPMDFAFLSAALRDTGVPPQDPWLSGYGISYYYFGHFLFALVAKLAAVPGGYAFNLALATLFGLTAAGAHGIVANLVAGRRGTADTSAGPPLRYGIMAGGVVLLLANLEGFFEVLRVNNVLPPDFWNWLGIRDLATAPRGSAWLPTDPPDTWWWWRASRVVGDFGASTGVARDYTINEFPFFSFLLGDLHPHVMSLPFLLLALALSLAILREPGEVSWAWVRQNKLRAGLYIVAFGALGFLNSWDLPTAAAILVLAATARRARTGGPTSGTLIWQAALLGLAVVAVSILAYGPFYLGFRTQASGIGFVAVRTKLQHLLVVWAPLLSIAGALPLYLAFVGSRRAVYRAVAGTGVVVALVAVAGLMFLDDAGWRQMLGDLAGVPTLLLSATTSVVLVAMLAPAVGAFWRHLEVRGDERGHAAPENTFALTLIGIALLLLLVCEVLFIRDGFGNRMNTVFKLYFQAWVLLALGAAYTLYYLGRRRQLSGWHGFALTGYRLWRGAALLLVACGLVYTVLAPWSKTGGFAGSPTLDGTAWLSGRDPSELAAIAWLSRQPGMPVLLEASGPEYSDFNRVSAYTGLPSVLGWAGHEYQWRGNTPEPGQRKAAIDTIYRTPDVGEARQLLDKYEIELVYVGAREQQTYADAPVGALTKFGRLGDVAFKSDRVVIYRIGR